jgi:hypothetical protein
MTLIEYITTNKIIKIGCTLFLVFLLIMTDIIHSNDYNYNNDFENFVIMNNTSNITNININECNKSNDYIYDYKNINFIFGIILIFLLGIYDYTNSYSNIMRLKLFMFVYLFITYVFGFMILLNNYLYDCTHLLIDFNKYNYFAFVLNYGIFCMFGILYILELSICKILLSGSCFIKKSPPTYESIDNVLPQYGEMSRDNPPKYEQNIQHSNNNVINV